MQAFRFLGAVFLFFTSMYRSVLVNFQVAQPPPVPKDAQQCTIKILQSVIAMTILCQIITQIIFRHDFANSYGQYVYLYYLDPLNGSPDCNFQCSRLPAVVNYTYAISQFTSLLVQTSSSRPPVDCGPVGSWAAITLDFTVTSKGRQYDRLGVFTFQNVESK